MFMQELDLDGLQEVPISEGWLTSSVTPKKSKKKSKNKKPEKSKEPMGFYKREVTTNGRD